MPDPQAHLDELACGLARAAEMKVGPLPVAVETVVVAVIAANTDASAYEVEEMTNCTVAVQVHCVLEVLHLAACSSLTKMD